MRLPLLLLGLGLASALSAQASLTVVAVARQGPPPYEAADRIYVLEGGPAPQVGDRLTVRRPGARGILARLRVTALRDGRTEARLVPPLEHSPMKGDLATTEVASPLLALAAPAYQPLPVLAAPRALPQAPPREGLLFFLPQRSDLSLAGMKKLEGWVEAWGTDGHYVIHMPTAKALRAELQKDRVESLRAALRSVGIAEATVDTTPRTTEGRNDPAWIRRLD